MQQVAFRFSPQSGIQFLLSSSLGNLQQVWGFAPCQPFIWGSDAGSGQSV